ncbi:hypothetical protein H7C19_29385 [Cohnella nanjingensis]|uniref:Uncharacterized protein n=1 Tax=Cohnella nanjingensis TaxID=1387779 RepID=A0A7X0VIQ9_9BACL|nr:hypothetical protein [Cohnella nanjingensis]
MHYSYISGIEHADLIISLEIEKIIDALDVVPLEVFQFDELDLTSNGRIERQLSTRLTRFSWSGTPTRY